jgi:hypothetical protein
MSYPFGNVNVGTSPGDGTGDPLRVAFETINNNFANIASGNITVIAPVQSVAGRTGNVLLTVNDVLGANVIGQTYVMGNVSNWLSPVYTVTQALDQIASRLKSGNL